MSRRDTIIVAVLVNAGLLIVLFASALKSQPASQEYAAAPKESFQEKPAFAFKKETARVPGDEVDQALHQFAHATPPASVPAPSSDFADDLKMTAVSETPATLPSLPHPNVQTLIAPISPQTNDSMFIEVKVKKGDVLEKIARHNHSTVAEIVKVNKLSNTNLRIGQVLKIPTRTIKKVETSTISYSSSETSSHTEESSKFYTVKKGDSPWTIAVKNHLKVEDLLKLNNMNEDQARHLKPGDQIRIQ